MIYKYIHIRTIGEYYTFLLYSFYSFHSENDIVVFFFHSNDKIKFILNQKSTQNRVTLGNIAIDSFWVKC